jgi:hypothetical protein
MISTIIKAVVEFIVFGSTILLLWALMSLLTLD